MKRFLKFEKKLHEGRIVSRPNRFIMNVNINGSEEKCHCPVTGKIFNINFLNSNIPCLLSNHSPSSEGKKSQRKTEWTVEAISFDHAESVNKTWIGINQTKVNSFIEHFLSQNQISFLPTHSPASPSTSSSPSSSTMMKIQREVKLGNSRIDFLIGSNHYLEIKTPLSLASFKTEIPSHINFLSDVNGNNPDNNNNNKKVKKTRKSSKITQNSSQIHSTRLVKHFNELTNQLITSSTSSSTTTSDSNEQQEKQQKEKQQSKASVCLVYMYDAKLFEPPPVIDETIDQAVKSSIEQGVTYHQINFSMNSEGITLIETLPIKF